MVSAPSDSPTGKEISFIHARSFEERCRWLKQVRRSGLITGNAFMVATYLYECCNSITGQCNPSRSKIEKECGITNAKRAIRKLEDEGFIDTDAGGFNHPQYGRSKSNQYFLILRTDDNFQHGSSATQEGDADDPGDGSQMTQAPGSPVIPKPCSVEPLNEPTNEPATESASEPSPFPGAIPDNWRPTDKDVDFALQSGMDNKEIELQVPLFVQYNLDIRKTDLNWSLNWKRWVTAWKRHQIEKASGETPKTRDDKIANDLKRILKPKGSCWERFGSPSLSPARDPDRFLRMGCSRTGSCECSQAKRQQILGNLPCHNSAKPEAA